jgi:hypothetical protein
MNTPVIRIIVLVCVVGLVGLSCKTAAVNQAPTITALDLPSSADAGTDVTFSCTATDPDGDPLTYDWTCSSGLLLSNTAKTVGWTAPETSGVATISVVVRDSSGASDTTSGTVTVNPLVTTIIEWDSTVAALGYRFWRQSIPVGYTVSGSFSAGGQLITFLVLDTINYQKWEFAKPYEGMVKKDSSVGSSFSIVIPSTAFYYFIFDNQNNASADTAVHLTVQTTSP